MSIQIDCLFKQAEAKQKEASLKSSSSTVSRVKLVLPFFKGQVHRTTTEGYTLTSAFLINLFTCIAQNLVQCENKKIKEHNKSASKADKIMPLNLSIYLIETLLEEQGIRLSEYKQGSYEGAACIKKSLQAFAKKENLDIKVDEKGFISMNDEIPTAVFKAVGFKY